MRIMGITEDIREAVERSGRSRYELARSSGVTESQLSRLVNGQRALRSDSIDRLAEALDLEIILRPKKTGKGAK
jgi:plasmid maintenance system antidote protein VapI